VSSLAEFGRRQSEKLRTLSRPQAVVLLIGGAACAGAWIAVAAGHPAPALTLLTTVLALLLVGALHLARWIGVAHRAQEAAAQELRTTVEHLQRRFIAGAEADRILAGERHAEMLAEHSAGRTTTDRAVREQGRQTEAMLQLHAGPDVRAPMPPAGGAALEPVELLALLHLVRTRQPRMVLELGSGTSTVWLAHALEKHGGRLIALEHDPSYAQQTRALLAAHGLESVAKVRDAPLTSVPIGSSTRQWYDPSAIAGLREIDLVLVDGPESPDPALPLLERKLAAAAIIVADPAAVDLDAIPGLSRERTLLGRHAVLLYTRAENSMATTAG